MADLQVLPGVKALLESLPPERWAIVTSATRRLLLARLKAAGLPVPERIISAEMVERGKPAPDLFLYAAERMQVDPQRALVIEDSVSGVRAGKAAGMTVWGFVGGSHYQSRDGKAILREAGADRVFGRMADFWRTDRQGD